MDLGLDGKVALVTGSYRGTGAGIARVLAAEGATVLVHGLEPGQADATVQTITDAGHRCRPVVGDLRTEAGTATLVAGVRDAAATVDIVVNNYGIAEGSDWESSDTASWHHSYDLNVVTAVRVTQAFLPDLRTAGWGRIVFVSTVGATRPGDRIPEYYAAKGALPAMAVSLAKHLAGTGITVNCVSPGIIATPEIVERYVAIGRDEGARVVCGGGRPDGLPGWYVEPTLFADVDNSMSVAREEIFGPVVCVIPYEDVDDAVRIANDSELGLAGGVFAEDEARALAVARRLRTGHVGINTLGMDWVLPFGGFKRSGVGRELGREGLATFQELQCIGLREGSPLGDSGAR